MSTNFAGVVDEVRQLSLEERRELIDVLEQSIIEERRADILENGEDAKRAFRKGELKLYSDVDDLMQALND